VEGARCIYGHTLLARYAEFGWFSEKANRGFGRDEAARVHFFTEVGKAAPSPQVLDDLAGIRGQANPENILKVVR
jgi:hypothetical protein